MNNLQFSVLLSVYYKEKPDYLKLALSSIWNQTLRPNEIIIVKDGPLTKELELILSDFAQQAPVKFIINEQNMGLSFALNKGLIACSNDIVARMDTDDISKPDRFENQIDFLNKHPDIDILGSFATKIDENGNEIELMKVPVNHKDIYRLIWTNPIIHPTVIFRKQKIVDVGSYNINSGIRMDDYELWFRCAKNKLHFCNLNISLLYYRFFSDSIKKRNIKVGISQFKIGFKGCIDLKLSMIAYIGIAIPLIRTLLPYPFNLWLNNLMNKCNPRNRK